MSRPLRLLLIEDSERDAAHVMLALKRGGLSPEIRRVETRDEMLAALGDGTWDAIVSDYHLPRFSAPDALETLRERGLDIPFIVVSGAIGEDTAVDMMRGGAHDYLLKDRLARLHAAIEREIDQAEHRRAKRRAETLFQAVLRASPHPSAIVDKQTQHIIDGSTSFSREFLGDEAFPVARRLTDVVRFSQPERVEQLLARGSGTSWHNVYYLHDIAHVANVRCYGVEHEGISYASVVLEDVTEQHYLKAAFDAVPDAVLVVSGDQRLLYANRTAEGLFGTLYFGMDVEPLLSRPGYPERWWVEATSRYEERRIVFNDQPWAATSVVFRLAGDANASTIVTLRDIAEEEELARLATHDALTGIFNVRHFSSVLEEEIGAGGVLALLDLDHFKPINDELGHAAGDAALITFTNAVRRELGGSDVFARLGGDEFALFFPRRTIEQATATIERVYERLARTPLRWDGGARPISISCGLAAIAQDETPAAAKERADHALYDAKRQGRGRWVTSGPAS